MICGDVSMDGEIYAPIKRSKVSFAKWQVDPEGKKAHSVFKVVRKYLKEGKTYSLVEIDLKTGRTHQIRVHFSYLRWPLFGDKLYGGEMEEYLKRPFLQSIYLALFHPVDQRRLEFEVGMAKDLVEALKYFNEK
jgi:23S rRNA pseudouridine1911/1915/1917 synthase